MDIKPDSRWFATVQGHPGCEQSQADTRRTPDGEALSWMCQGSRETRQGQKRGRRGQHQITGSVGMRALEPWRIRDGTAGAWIGLADGAMGGWQWGWRKRSFFAPKGRPGELGALQRSSARRATRHAQRMIPGAAIDERRVERSGRRGTRSREIIIQDISSDEIWHLSSGRQRGPASRSGVKRSTPIQRGRNRGSSMRRTR